MLRKLLASATVLLVMLLAWVAWHPPGLPVQAEVVRYSIPNIAPLERGIWRVVTKRMVWKKAVESMREQLQGLGHAMVLIQKREPVELHAFDDQRIFKTKKEAYAAKAWWKKRHIDADVVDVSDAGKPPIYRVELGRYYMRAYAEEALKTIAATGKAYRYQKRSVMIPSYRFAFPEMSKSEAEILWQRLQHMGIADPVMLQKEKFDELYGDYLSKSAKRSNK